LLVIGYEAALIGRDGIVGEVLLAQPFRTAADRPNQGRINQATLSGTPTGGSPTYCCHDQMTELSFPVIAPPKLRIVTNIGTAVKVTTGRWLYGRSGVQPPTVGIWTRTAGLKLQSLWDWCFQIFLEVCDTRRVRNRHWPFVEIAKVAHLPPIRQTVGVQSSQMTAGCCDNAGCMLSRR